MHRREAAALSQRNVHVTGARAAAGKSRYSPLQQTPAEASVCKAVRRSNSNSHLPCSPPLFCDHRLFAVQLPEHRHLPVGGESL